MDSSLFATSIIFLFKTMHIDASAQGGVVFMDYIHYSFKKNLMEHGYYITDVKLERLCETGVGGLQRGKPLQRG